MRDINEINEEIIALQKANYEKLLEMYKDLLKSYTTLYDGLEKLKSK